MHEVQRMENAPVLLYIVKVAPVREITGVDGGGENGHSVEANG